MAIANPVTNLSRQRTVKHLTRYRYGYGHPIPPSKHCVHLWPIGDA